MVVASPNIEVPPRPIRRLDEAAVNRIAAGEVVERPASAVKELVENALDAGARRIDVAIAGGGKTLIRVADDGHGIPARDLPLALTRHATSKLDGDDLVDVRFLGFRGEALASIAAVARLTLVSRAAGAGEAARIEVAGGILGAVRPAALARGTVVEIADLFHATPARLKFLRSDRAELQAILDVIRRLAMAAPDVAFTVTETSEPARARTLLALEAESGALVPALSRRLRAILGPAFAEAAVVVEGEREGLRLEGFAALPTHSRGAAVDQYLFVNGRPVRDRLLLGALRAAYADTLARDRHPAAALFLAVQPARVDVNVHPAKTEVRFREPGEVRGLLVGAIRQALAGAGHRAAAPVASRAALGAFRSGVHAPHRPAASVLRAARDVQAPAGFGEALPGFGARSVPPAPEPASADEGASAPEEALPPERPLGVARVQLLDTYILAQTADGIALVDQHAAHERLVYERLKAAARAGERVASQGLLIPEIVELGTVAAERVVAEAETLGRLGLAVEPFGGGAVCLRETPALLGAVDGAGLVRDVADALCEAHAGAAGAPVAARLDAVMSRMACHGSVRAGRRMGPAEMDALLRAMEAEPASLTCNHGRPTVLHLHRADIERLFGRR
jgi:DNA mismatch repair protein MutL